MENILTKEKIEEIVEKEDMVFLYFGSESCSVCVDLKPKIEDLLDKYREIKYIHIDINENLKLTREYDIFTMPAILLYIEGKEVIREARYLSVQELEEKIARYHSLLYEK